MRFDKITAFSSVSKGDDFPSLDLFWDVLERMWRVAGLQPQPPSFARVIYFPFSEKSNCNFERLWSWPK